MNIQSAKNLIKIEVVPMLSLALPIVVANIGNVAIGETDKIMIRGLGVDAIDAAGFATSLFFLIAVLGIGTLSVLAPQVAASKGMNDSLTISKLLYAGLRLGWLIGIVLAGLIFGLVLMLDVFHQSSEVTQKSQIFLTIIGISIIPMMIFLSLKYFADGLSFTRVDMYITVGAFFFNILLNWLLINGNLGFPALGLIGSALATLISRTAMAIAVYIYVFKDKHFAAYRSEIDMNLIRPYLVKILKQGFPAGLQIFFEAGAFTFAVIMAGWISKFDQAAHIIAIGWASFTFMMMAGIASAGAIRVGQSRGANDRSAIRRSGTVALIIVILCMSLFCILFLTIPEPLVSLYINTDLSHDAQKVIPIAITLLIIAGFFQLSDGIQVVSLAILRGLGDIKIPTFITLLAYWIIGLPLGYFLGFKLNLGVKGIWYGLTAGLTVSAILLTTRFYNLAGKIKLRKIKFTKSKKSDLKEINSL